MTDGRIVRIKALLIVGGTPKRRAPIVHLAMSAMMLFGRENEGTGLDASDGDWVIALFHHKGLLKIVFSQRLSSRYPFGKEIYKC
jgi:hypothetical protein